MTDLHKMRPAAIVNSAEKLIADGAPLQDISDRLAAVGPDEIEELRPLDLVEACDRAPALHHLFEFLLTRWLWTQPVIERPVTVLMDSYWQMHAMRALPMPWSCLQQAAIICICLRAPSVLKASIGPGGAPVGLGRFGSIRDLSEIMRAGQPAESGLLAALPQLRKEERKRLLLLTDRWPGDLWPDVSPDVTVVNVAATKPAPYAFRGWTLLPGAVDDVIETVLKRLAE